MTLDPTYLTLLAEADSSHNDCAFLT
jgi:hypothetical protein